METGWGRWTCKCVKELRVDGVCGLASGIELSARGFCWLSFVSFLRLSGRYSYKKRWFTSNFIDLELLQTRLAALNCTECSAAAAA